MLLLRQMKTLCVYKNVDSVIEKSFVCAKNRDPKHCPTMYSYANREWEETTSRRIWFLHFKFLFNFFFLFLFHAQCRRSTKQRSFFLCVSVWCAFGHCLGWLRYEICFSMRVFVGHKKRRDSAYIVFVISQLHNIFSLSVVHFFSFLSCSTRKRKQIIRGKTDDEKKSLCVLIYKTAATHIRGSGGIYTKTKHLRFMGELKSIEPKRLNKTYPDILTATTRICDWTTKRKKRNDEAIKILHTAQDILRLHWTEPVRKKWFPVKTTNFNVLETKKRIIEWTWISRLFVLDMGFFFSPLLHCVRCCFGVCV